MPSDSIYQDECLRVKVARAHHEPPPVTPSSGVKPGGERSEGKAGGTVQEERLRAQAEMASSIAHDLNNSLTPIIGFSDYLLDMASGLPDDCRKCIQGIRNAAEDIAGMVEQMRKFYRPRQVNERVQALDLNSIIQEALEVAKVGRETSHLRFETRLRKGLPTVTHQAGELREAVAQVILNGVEAMPDGGTLCVSTRPMPTRSAFGGRRILVEVTDTGMGMNALTRQKCLEPFFTTKGPRRNGLGLSMVFGAMRRHQGSIEIHSQEGLGTSVRLIFNATEAGASS